MAQIIILTVLSKLRPVNHVKICKSAPNEWTIEWASEWMSEWMNEWMNECLNWLVGEKYWGIVIYLNNHIDSNPCRYIYSASLRANLTELTSASLKAVWDVNSLGLQTTVLPVMIAGAIWNTSTGHPASSQHITVRLYTEVSSLYHQTGSRFL